MYMYLHLCDPIHVYSEVSLIEVGAADSPPSFKREYRIATLEVMMSAPLIALFIICIVATPRGLFSAPFFLPAGTE